MGQNYGVCSGGGGEGKGKKVSRFFTLFLGVRFDKSRYRLTNYPELISHKINTCSAVRQVTSYRRNRLGVGASRRDEREAPPPRYGTGEVGLIFGFVRFISAAQKWLKIIESTPEA